MEALKKIRLNDISHLDIKVDNIFLHLPLEDKHSKFVLKIGDFGLA